MKRICYIALGLLFSMTPALYSMSRAKRKSLPVQEAPIKEPALTFENEMTPVDVSGQDRKKVDLLLGDHKLSTIIYHLGSLDSFKRLKANNVQTPGVDPFQAVIESIDMYDGDNQNAYQVLLAYALLDVIDLHEEQKKSFPKHVFTIEALVRPNMKEFFGTIGFSETSFLGLTRCRVSQCLTPEKTKLLKDFCSTQLALVTSDDQELLLESRRSSRLKLLKEAAEKK